MIRYFWPSDDEQLAGQWQDSHFDEDGGWWANVQQCGAALALVVAATLTSGSTAVASTVFNQHQDDPAGFLNNTPFAQEEYAQPLVPPVNWPQPSVFTDDDIHVQFVQTFVPDDGDWKPLVQPDIGANYVRLPFLDPDETPVGSFQPIPNPVDDSSVWAPQNPPWDPNWTLLFFLDDGSTVPEFQYDEDFWLQLVPAQNWPQPAQPFSSSDEDNLVPEFVAAEDPVWLQLVQPVLDSLRWPQQFAFEQNDNATLVAFADEIFWANPVYPVPDSLTWPQQFQFEQTDATGALSIGNDPDSLQPLLVFPVADSLVWPQQFNFDSSEIFPSAPFTDEHYWQNPTAPVPDGLIWPQPFVFEQTDATGSLAAIIDELYAPSLIYPVPASFTAFQQFSQHQDDPAGSLYILVDEHYWQNPVPPVNWPQPSVFIFDEQIIPQPSAGIDEFYWSQFLEPWVPPVPDSMHLDLPFGAGFGLLTDPEEIPAGSLFTPTPPPIVPCKPPVGFDADTNITYFGGKNPTQALFCRVCNSGKPLLVRGDYAIWCQDCCAFVSKADTVMGTVRAPGAFRGRF